MNFSTREVEADDLPHLLAMNNLAVPAVNSLEADDLVDLVAMAHAALVVVDDEHPESALGLVIAFAAGTDYESENYRWFEARSGDFLYVDRIVVAADARGQGLGRLLYDEVFAEAARSVLSEVTCEVNLDPPNPRSLAFHDRLGFVQVGELSTKNDTVRVALLAATVPPSR